ncbi:MAG: family 20 glycosylhydrolase [Armatimonadetes bacterium]|nr:family 20 glycosylhydrolase [Armatimonadota bacterium]MDW8027819.1 family 20 glycosylhydrolase [Armatimonadota bacterium]
MAIEASFVNSADDPEAQHKSAKVIQEKQRELLKGVHILAPNPDGLSLLRRAIEEQLAPLGINALVFEVNYKFAYRSDPDLRMEPALSYEDARSLSELCRKVKIRLIPEFNCLGHQSWGKTTFPLLLKYREFDETPEIPLDNPGIYCRSWCPLHPKVNQVVFALIDELLEAFQADAFHVGMDEVFLLASEQCPRCKGKDPAELFAKAVNDYHEHLVKKRGAEMLMWGDRLLDDKEMGYGKWEASQNGTAPAIDKIPKDIIICDWHYGLRHGYPSIPYFQKKGFRTVSASWKDDGAAIAFLNYSCKVATEKWLGHMCTTWVDGSDFAKSILGMQGASETAYQASNALRACIAALEKEAKS